MMTDDMTAFAESNAAPSGAPQRHPHEGATTASGIVFGAIRIGLTLFGRRALLVLSLLGTFTLFGYAILYPSVLTILTASLFAVLAFLPLLWTSRQSVKP